MPVSKHRHITELGPPPVSDSATENVRAAVELMELCLRLRPWRPGVRRHRSVEAPAEPPGHSAAGAPPS